MSNVELKKYAVCSACKGIGESSVKRTRSSLLLPSINKQKSSSLHTGKPETYLFSASSGDIHLPTLTEKYCRAHNSTAVKRAVNTGDYTRMLEYDFLGVPEAFENPQHVLKVALHCLKQNQWQSSTPAIINLMQISRFQPDLLDAHMPLINRTLCSLMKNIRPQIVRTACQVAMELYKTIQCTQRPEFDELAAMLLLKSTHTNKGISYDAQRALDAMVTHLPLSTCVRILASEHGVGNKNPLIRVTTSRLVYDIVHAIQINYLMTCPNIKDTRQRILTMCAKFLLDGHYETRNNSKKALKLLMNYSDFDTLFYQDVDHKLWKNTRKELVAIKYEKP